MTILQHSIAQAAAAATGYQIARSLRFNSGDSAYLNRTLGTATNQKKWTWSGWVKRSALPTAGCVLFSSVGSGAAQTYIAFGGSTATGTAADSLNLFGAPTQDNISIVSNNVYRDLSAWYHIVVAVDTTQATAANRVRMYVNGVEVSYATSTYPLLNQNLKINSAYAHSIGANTVADSWSRFDGYITEIYFIDGQQLDPTSFGQTDSATGVWMPKQVTGMTYGTNGFYLNFSDNSNTTAATLGKDSSGNSNNWTPNNFSVTAGVNNDSLVDTPTNYGTDTGAGGEVRGNYATLNSLDKGALDTTNGNLDFVRTSATTDWEHSRGTIQIPSTGKWYWEVTFNGGTTDGIVTGVCPSTFSLSADFGAGSYANVYAWTSLRNLTVNNSTTAAYGTTPSAGDVIMCAFDRDNSKIYFGLNGTWFNSSNPVTQTNPAASSIPTEMFPFCGSRSTGSGSLNHGQRPFAYTAPSGFKALCTQNLPTPAIGATSSTLASKNFDVSLWTGAGQTGAVSITGLGFQPDFVWSKTRSGGNSHLLYDVLRGPSTSGASKALVSNANATEGSSNDNASYGYLSAFNSDGFSYYGGSTPTYFSGNGSTYVGWQWKAGGTGVSNTAGSITSTVSANATAGISIATYTGNGTSGATFGHGLGVVPKMIMFKCRNTAYDWLVYHASMGNTALIALNSSAAQQTGRTDFLNSTTPSSSLVTLGNTLGVN